MKTIESTTMTSLLQSLQRFALRRRLRRRLPALAFAAVAAAPAYAAQTGELGGVVVDDAGEPLADISVILSSQQMIGGTKEAVTDGAGEFRFPNLDPGSYTVVLSSSEHVGFEESDIYVGIDARVDREYLLEKASTVGGDQKVFRLQ